MVIAILSLRPDQNIPRPFSRASSIDELRELLLPYVGVDVAVNKIDTEEPLGSAVLYGQRVKFFAFTER
ncbi:MAG: hypothetical protein KGL39_49785 [Patescibacteria group bacterium]|nr:hypothetical protein [Patescibacteria group bacterium]